MEEGGTVLGKYSIAYADLDLGESIGEGSFGTVYKGTLRGEQRVAIKTMRMDKVTPDAVGKFKAEIKVRAN